MPLLIFSTTGTIIQKSSCQSLGSICVVSILERQVLQMHTTLKSLRRKFELYICYISAPVYGTTIPILVALTYFVGF